MSPRKGAPELLVWPEPVLDLERRLALIDERLRLAFDAHAVAVLLRRRRALLLALEAAKSSVMRGGVFA
jgi:hypothetical protein